MIKTSSLSFLCNIMKNMILCKIQHTCQVEKFSRKMWHLFSPFGKVFLDKCVLEPVFLFLFISAIKCLTGNIYTSNVQTTEDSSVLMEADNSFTSLGLSPWKANTMLRCINIRNVNPVPLPNILNLEPNVKGRHAMPHGSR